MTEQDKKRALVMKAAAAVASSLSTEELQAFHELMYEVGMEKEFRTELRYFAKHFAALKLN